MDDAHDAPEAEANNATTTNFYNDLPAVECGQAAQNSPVGPTPGDPDSPLITIAAV